MILPNNHYYVVQVGSAQGYPKVDLRADITAECNMDVMHFEIWVDLEYMLRSV
jgi:hypothetical protein